MSVDWLARIATLDSVAEVAGFAWALRILGLDLPDDAAGALARRRIELQQREGRR